MIGNPLLRNKSQNQDKSMREEDIPRLHHDFMVAYGWIPVEEFKQVPIHRILQLKKYIEEDKKQEMEFRKAILKGQGYKIK